MRLVEGADQGVVNWSSIIPRDDASAIIRRHWTVVIVCHAYREECMDLSIYGLASRIKFLSDYMRILWKSSPHLILMIYTRGLEHPCSTSTTKFRQRVIAVNFLPADHEPEITRSNTSPSSGAKRMGARWPKTRSSDRVMTK